jgi:uncharacterized membrane protein
MNNNSRIQQIKTEPKWHAVSLALGITPVMILVIFIVLGYINNVIIGIIGWACFVFPIFGFVLGILGLRDPKRKMAIAGIVLSVIGFVAFFCLLSYAASNA